MPNNGKQDPEELPGIPVDGQFYTVEDLNGREQRELRTVMRELTGNENATLIQLLEFGLVDDFDYACAMTYVVRKRGNEKYTLDDALELSPKDITEEGARLKKELGRRPRKAASSSAS